MTPGAGGQIYVDEKLRLPLQERDRRWKRVWLGMAVRGLDCLLVYGSLGDSYGGQLANLSYLTSLRDAGFCLFPLEDEPIAFVGYQNMFDPYSFYSSVQDWVTDVRSADPGLSGGGLAGVVSAIKELGLERGHIGLVDGHEKAVSSLPYKFYNYFKASLPHAEFTDETSLFTELRLVKSDVEVKLLERAGHIAHEMISAMAGSARREVREIDIYNEMMRVYLECGGDPHHFILLASGPIDETSHMLHGKLPPYAPSQRRLQDGDVVLVEFHAAFGGYLVAAEKTLVLGEAPPEFRRVHDVAVGAYKKGTDKMRPGVPFNEAVEAYREPVLSAGMHWLELGIHQHGLSSSGFPSEVYPYDRTKYLPIRRPDGRLANASSFELQAGMVFGQNIDIHDRQWRSNIGVMLGDTILIEEGGPRPLCDTPLDLLVVGE